MSARNLFNLALGVGWVFFAIPLLAALYSWLFAGIPINDPAVLFIYGFVVLAGIAVFVMGRIWSPVKVNSATEETVTISIANPSYAQEFEKLNRGAIIVVLPWWRR